MNPKLLFALLLLLSLIKAQTTGVGATTSAEETEDTGDDSPYNLIWISAPIDIPTIDHGNKTLCGKTGPHAQKNFICNNETGWQNGTFQVSTFPFPAGYRIKIVQIATGNYSACPDDGNQNIDFFINGKNIGNLVAAPSYFGGCFWDDTVCTGMEGAQFIYNATNDFPVGLDANGTVGNYTFEFRIFTNAGLCFFGTELRFGITDEPGEIVTTGSTSLPSEEDGFPLWYIAIIAGAALLLLIMIVMIAVFATQKRKKRRTPEEMELADKTGTEYARVPALPSDYTNIALTPAEFQPSDSSARWTIPYSELEMTRELGRGGFGIVFLGRWRNADVAVKQMIMSRNIARAEYDNFIAEATLLSALRPHTNIVQFQGACIEPGKPLCIVTEFLAQGDLFNWLRKNDKALASDPKLINRIICGIAAGLRHLQSEGIVHRDLAARNVLLSGTLVPKISDFGMSRFTEADTAAVTQSTVGPLKWMSPELLLKQEYGVKSDVWSFGVLLVEIVTRDEPYPLLNNHQAAAQVMTREAVLSMPEGTNPIIVEAFNRCMVWDPIERADFHELCTILERLQA